MNIRKYEDVLKEELIVCSHILSVLLHGFVAIEIKDYTKEKNNNVKIMPMTNKYIDINQNEEVLLECVIHESCLMSMTKIKSDDEIDKYVFYLVLCIGSIYSSNNTVICIIRKKDSDNVQSLVETIILNKKINYKQYKEHLTSLYKYFKLTNNNNK